MAKTLVKVHKDHDEVIFDGIEGTLKCKCGYYCYKQNDLLPIDVYYKHIFNPEFLEFILLVDEDII